MNIEILHGFEGAKKAKGLTVIIDVFRAFTTSCYAIANGADFILATGSVELANDLKLRDKKRILIGERNGFKCDGFDFGNSPAEISQENFLSKEIILTTSAGTQGLVQAKNASEIITGSFVNAGAIVHYINQLRPENVSLVPLGLAGVSTSEEDLICAEFIYDMLMNYYRCIKKYQFRVIYHYKDKLEKRIAEGSWHKDDLKYCLDFNHFSFVLKAKIIAEDCAIITKETIW